MKGEGANKRIWLVQIIICFCVFLVGATLKFSCWFCTVRGHSMEPTIPDGSIGVANLHTEVERGELVVAKVCDELVIKRVIGLPGDHITVDGDTVIVNGEELEEPYVVFEGTFDEYVDVDVTDGKYFLLGDNRSDSLDSRYFGVVDANQIIGVYYNLYTACK